jgi:hypothetical protein
MKHYRSITAALAVMALPMVTMAASIDDLRYANRQEDVAPASTATATTSADDADATISYQLDIATPDKLVANRPTTLQFSLSRNGEPLTMDQLKTVHTRKLHALIVDPTLTDYQHVHPRAIGAAGEYNLHFTPKTDRPYLLWIDMTPKGGQQLYLHTVLPGDNNETPMIDRTETREVTLRGYHFTLSFDGPVTAGEAVMGHVNVTAAATGEPVTALQPVMGAFAHVVGIYDDDETITHVHPMGMEPTNDSQRGGPELDFHLEPKYSGFIKLFAQVRIGGKDYFAPFGVRVE